MGGHGEEKVDELMSLVAIEEYLESTETGGGDTTLTIPPESDYNVERSNGVDDVGVQLAHDRSKKERSMDVRATGKEAETSFEDLQLREKTLSGLKKCGFYVPSPIQLKAIPFGKFGYDLILQSKSGTGKTCAFGVIILEQIDVVCENVQALVLAPTREIACQNCDVIKSIGCLTPGLIVKSFIGGTSVEQSKRRSKQCNVASGSPGRILHMINDDQMDVSNIRIVVLDEADKLMESPFMSDVTSIFEALPSTKQVIAASATYSDSLKDFVKRFMCQPMEIAADVTQGLLAINLYAADIHKILEIPKNANQEEMFASKMKVLLEILRNLPFTQAIVFSRCLTVEKIYDDLKEYSFHVVKLTGALAQQERLLALRATQQGKCKILISSDLGARGIDCEGVDLVINFEPPDDAFTFVHRYGRAGRFGSSGICITLMTYRGDFRCLAEYSKKVKSEIKVIQTLQQIKLLGQGQAHKLERLHLREAKASLQDPENQNWKEMLAFCLEQPLEFPSLTMDLHSGFKLNVDFDAMWREVQSIKKRNE